MDGLLILKIVLLIVLLTCSGLISGAEVAFFGLSQTELNELAESGTARARIISRLLDKPKKLLATILIANNAINIGIVLLLNDIGDTVFSGIDQIYLGFISGRFLLEVILATFLILLFGEILPKIYANRNRRTFAYRMTYVIRTLDVLFTPLTGPMRRGTNLLYKRLGKQRTNLSVDHLSQALELTSEGDTTREEQKILEGIVSFGNTDTKQVMRPRLDIFALPEDLKYPEVLEEIKKNGYSRIPVYSENLDNVSGVLYVKDLLPYLERKSFNWVSLIRKPFFVPENKKLDDLLLEFKNKKNHLAVVVDEFGGTSGIVTLEDVIEEIVGDISDEFDDEDLVYSKLDDHNYVFEGKTNLKDFYRAIHLEDDSEFEAHKGESETIAGFVLEISGRFPRRGEKIGFAGFQFTVESIDKKRLKQIKVTLPHEA
jgi:gliding motility-associated protein GldE